MAVIGSANPSPVILWPATTRCPWCAKAREGTHWLCENCQGVCEALGLRQETRMWVDDA